MVRKIKAKLVLRLRADGLSGRQIALQGMSRHSVAAVIDAAVREGVSWDDVADLDEQDAYARLFPGRGEHVSVHAQPDWSLVHRELARGGVTLKLLHGEYCDSCRASRSTAMGYDRFCKSYQQYVLIAGSASVPIPPTIESFDRMRQWSSPLSEVPARIETRAVRSPQHA